MIGKKVEIPTKPIRIIRSDVWLTSLYDFKNPANKAMAKAREILLSEKYSVKDTDITYRLINTWSTAGIITDRRKADDGWRRLTFIDLIWLHLLTELRKFGLSIEQLQYTYKTAFFCEGEESKPWEMFAVAVAKCFYKANVSVIVFNDGYMTPVFDSELELHSKVHSDESYVKVNLNRIVKKAYPQLPESEKSIAIELSKEQLEIVKILETNKKIKSIGIHLKNGTVDRIETINGENNYAGSLDDLVQNLRHGEVTIKVKDGTLAYAERKESNTI